MMYAPPKERRWARPLRDLNKALKAKWLWRFAKEDNIFRKNLVKMKYDVDKLGWWSKKSPTSHGVGCWKSIISQLDHFKSLVHFKAGNGFKVLFWHDVWCEERPLRDHFPDLFFLARFKDATVQHVTSCNEDQNHWNIIFSRSPTDWEEENNLALLANVKVAPCTGG